LKHSPYRVGDFDLPL